MPICRTCKKEWPAGNTVCPDDGSSFFLEGDATMAPGPSQVMAAVSAGPASAAMAVAHAPQPQIDEPPQSGDLLPGAQIGEYRVDKKIGEGGMGAVYSATHPMIGKRAAIKVISSALGTDASAVGRFVQEARSVNQIGHPNIVDVFAFGELPDGRNYFVMEYLKGESLADRMHNRTMALGESIEILDQVADALEAAHEKQIVHRDLKPDNVYLAEVRGGRTMVKLLDFGIAKLSTSDGDGTGPGIAKTRTGMMMGTPGYLSPEQARGKNVDHRTDVYALGCMVFEIVCGRLPFVADNAMDIVLAHMTEPPVRASNIWPEIPPPLDDLIARMLEKDAALRPTLPEVRALFSELVTSGLVTLDNKRGMAFGSGISRVQNTQAGGLVPRGPQTGPMMAVGTQPSADRPASTPPMMTALVDVPKKKTGLIAAVIGGVVVLGGVGGFMAMKGDDPKPAPVAAAPVAAPLPTPEPPKPEPPKPEPPKPVVEVKAEPATVALVLNVDKAEVAIDGKPVVVTGKTATASVDAGQHLLTVTAAGREPYEAMIETKAGETTRLVARLERARSGSSSKKVTGTTGAKTGTTTTTTTTATTPAGDQKKGPDVKKDATVDPFAD